MRIAGDHCPLDRLDAAQCAEKGLLIRRALDLMSALKLAVHIGLDEIRADEFCAMLIIAEERDLLDGRSRRDREITFEILTLPNILGRG
jgi:hypothetical protein